MPLLLKTIAKRFGGWIAAAIFGALWLGSLSANGELRENCNTRIATAAAEAQEVARVAQLAAIEQQRRRWQEILTVSEARAEQAYIERQAASDRADELRKELNDVYRQDDEAGIWADTVLPAAVLERLRDDI